MKHPLTVTLILSTLILFPAGSVAGWASIDLDLLVNTSAWSPMSGTFSDGMAIVKGTDCKKDNNDFCIIYEKGAFFLDTIEFEAGRPKVLRGGNDSIRDSTVWDNSGYPAVMACTTWSRFAGSGRFGRSACRTYRYDAETATRYLYWENNYSLSQAPARVLWVLHETPSGVLSADLEYSLKSENWSDTLFDYGTFWSLSPENEIDSVTVYMQYGSSKYKVVNAARATDSAGWIVLNGWFNDLSAKTGYSERYLYDSSGNILREYYYSVEYGDMYFRRCSYNENSLPVSFAEWSLGDRDSSHVEITWVASTPVVASRPGTCLPAPVWRQGSLEGSAPSTDALLEVRSLTGRLLLSRPVAAAMPWNLSWQPPAGVYLVSLTSASVRTVYPVRCGD